jgi:hypothetical protein
VTVFRRRVKDEMRTRKLFWPPKAIGLGAPLNLATFLRLPHAEIARRALESVTFAILGATLVAAIDYFFFEAVTARATPALDEHPTPTARVLITFIGGLLEELFFRVLFATAVASVVWLALRRLITQREMAVTLAQWTSGCRPSIRETPGSWRSTPSEISSMAGSTGGADSSSLS